MDNRKRPANNQGSEGLELTVVLHWKPEQVPLEKLIYMPSLQRGLLAKTSRLSADIPQKIRHFSIPSDQISRIYRNRAILDSALNITLEKETFRGQKPNDLFIYARKLEEKYSADISRMRLFLDELLLTPGDFISKTHDLLYLVKNFSKEELFEPGKMLQGVRTSIPAGLEELIEEFREIPTEDRSKQVLAGWLLHFAVLHSLPSEALAARLIHRLYLRSVNCDADNLLFFLPELLSQQIQYRKIAEQLKYKDWQSFRKSDLSAILNFGLKIQLESLERTNDMLREIYQGIVEYEDMTPRQRNMVNYFFEEAFRNGRPETTNLNPRQQKIIELIHERHFISTKDLSLLFRVNRKTIQRDFTELLDLGIVRAMGFGSALRYTVPIRLKLHQKLESYQNVNLGEQMLQISLFGTSQETKKPAAIMQQALF